MSRLDLGGFRALFPALEQTAYLATAGVAPGARPVLDAVRRALDEWELGSFSWRAWEAEADTTRDLFARLVGVEAETVALCSSLAEAAATVAASLPAGRIVLHEREFRSNLFPWLALEQHGSTVAPVPGPLTTESLVRATREGTMLVAVSAVQSSNGVRVDLGAVAERCREVGARLFVNGTQSLGVLRLDLAGVRPDYLAGHGYKWLLCPRGAAWLHVRADRLEEVGPLAASWKSGPAPLERYYGGPWELAPDARKLDGSLGWFAWVGARAALELLLDLDPDAVEERSLALAAAFRAEAARLGLTVAHVDVPSHVVGVSVQDADGLARQLAERRVAAAVRDGSLRVGFHGFNDERDLAALVAALRAA